MNNIGRNDPCPCGSGKKYKNCCLKSKQTPESKEIIWRDLGKASDKLSQILRLYAFSLYGPDLLEAGWKDFIMDFERKYDENTHDYQIFIPWLLYKWLPAIERYFDGDYFNGNCQTVAEYYLAQHYDQLSALERGLIKSSITQPYTFYEIIDCNPGKGFRLKELMLGTEIDVFEKRGSQNACNGYVLFGQVVQYKNVGMVMGLAPILMPPAYKVDVIQMRKSIIETIGFLNDDILLLGEMVIRSLYLVLYQRMFTPPKFANTDRDPLILHEIYYDIDAPQIVFDKLKTLALDVEEQELLSEAKFDKNGALMEIKFNWLKSGNTQFKSWENTILGDIIINKRQLKICVNSEKRAATIKKKIEESLKGHAVYKRTKIQSTDALMARIQKERDSPTNRNTPEAPYPPELQEVLDQAFADYWKEWMNQEIPAIGNISPIEAVKSSDGREMVKALLDDMESRDKNVAPHQSQQKHIDWVRQQLGMTQSKQNLEKK